MATDKHVCRGVGGCVEFLLPNLVGKTRPPIPVDVLREHED